MSKDWILLVPEYNGLGRSLHFCDLQKTGKEVMTTDSPQLAYVLLTTFFNFTML